MRSHSMNNEPLTINNPFVSAQQMQQIESRMFEAGMPVAALMEKAANLCFQKIQELYPRDRVTSVGVIIGSGHNGGDALVVARELHLVGYKVLVYQALSKQKELTAAHCKYVASLGVVVGESLGLLKDCDLIIDGLFGFGLTREITGKLAEDINELNSWQKPVVAIDLPSGIHTDTGAIMGTAVKATHTLCLGLWKRAFIQDNAITYIGKAIKLDFGILQADIKAVINPAQSIQTFDRATARQVIPLPRLAVTYKYQQGNLLLICGSRRYQGAAILNALGARKSGVGMLTIAVPQSLTSLIIAQVPEALVIGCPETSSGAIASLPLSTEELNKYDAIAVGSGLTTNTPNIIQQLLTLKTSLIIDADGLNILATLPRDSWIDNNQLKILTPHPGEFKRLFPEIPPRPDRLTMAQQAAQTSNSIVLFKGAKTAIADPSGKTWVIAQSTPALARGGSGDVLTGLLGGLLAQQPEQPLLTTALAAWLHAQAGIMAATAKTELGVDGVTLAEFLTLAIKEAIRDGNQNKQL